MSRFVIATIKKSVATLPEAATLSFSELTKLLIQKNCVPSGVDSSRYAAMVRSVMLGNTVLEDYCYGS